MIVNEEATSRLDVANRALATFSQSRIERRRNVGEAWLGKARMARRG